ncbi:hypothetical protein LLG95_02830 [bacterium]|nr:hypothetical protein [bacterium]
MNDIKPEVQTATTPAPAEAKPKKRLSSGPFGGEGIPFGSNEMRLTGWQWLATLVIAAAVLWAIPHVWSALHPVKLSAPLGRVPFDLGNDYWMVEQSFNAMLKGIDNAVVGDSVMWGAYVAPENTLASQLTQRAGAKFANLGISGCHPVANYGLVKYYGKSIANKNVLIQFNPLWLSTPREDLTTTSLAGINHPKLLPQLSESIPAYGDTGFDERFGIALKHHFSIYGWVMHMQTVAFGGDDIPAWTVKNPYSVPAVQEFPDLPTDKAPSLAKPWTTRKIKQVDFQFVPLDKSYQWRYFCKLVELLQQRGNKVFVLVGPYNEHMMKGKAVDRYKNEIKPGMEKWLKEHNVPYLAPAALPTEIYTDSSHPILNGYGLIADQLMANADFKKMFVK